MLASTAALRPYRRSRRSTRTRLTLLSLSLLVCVLIVAGPAAAEETTATVAGGAETTGTAGSSTETGTAGLAQPGLIAGPADFATLNPGVSVTEQVVTILPEYDTTSTELLVFVDLELPESVPLPATFKFVVPANARVTGFAQVDAQGQYDYNRPNPQFEAQGDYMVVTVTVPTYRKLHLEYYYSPGAGMPEQGAKSYAVTFTVSVDTQTLYVYTQEPKRAEAFDVQPAAQIGDAASDGYRYAQNIFSGAKAGDQATVTVSYTKNDADTSEAAVGGPTEQQQSGATWLLWILVVLVVGVLAFAAYRVFVWRRASGSPRATAGRSPSSPKGAGRGGAKGGTTSRGQAPGKRASSGGTSGPPNRFCTQCGARLNKRDRFCPECGHERET